MQSTGNFFRNLKYKIEEGGLPGTLVLTGTDSCRTRYTVGWHGHNGWALDYSLKLFLPVQQEEWDELFKDYFSTDRLIEFCKKHNLNLENLKNGHNG